MGAAKQYKTDPQFFKPFIDGAIKALKVQCSLEIIPGKPYFKNEHIPDIEIAAVIGLVSSAYTGTITLSFPKAAFLEAMGNMLMEKFTEITDDLQDGAAELLNIIFGQAKIGLNNAGHDIQKAIPAVIRGQQLKTSHHNNGPVIVIPFTSKVGPFYMEMSVEEI